MSYMSAEDIMNQPFPFSGESMKHLAPDVFKQAVENNLFMKDFAKFYLKFDEKDITFETWNLLPVDDEHEIVPGGLYFTSEEAAMKVVDLIGYLHRYALVAPSE